jgi:hypothetical protein
MGTGNLRPPESPPEYIKRLSAEIKYFMRSSMEFGASRRVSALFQFSVQHLEESPVDYVYPTVVHVCKLQSTLYIAL